MVIRIVLGFLLLWSLVIAHYAWSAAHLHVFLGEIEFNAPEPARYRIGFLPPDRYSVVFWLAPGGDMSDADRSNLLRKLAQGRVEIEWEVTDSSGNSLLNGGEVYDLRSWAVQLAYKPAPMLWRKGRDDTTFALSLFQRPFKRHFVSAQLSGENDFLEAEEVLLGLAAERDAGYHGVGHAFVIFVTGLIFALIAIVWTMFKLVAFVQRRRMSKTP